MKIAGDVRKYAAGQKVSNEEVLRIGMKKPASFTKCARISTQAAVGYNIDTL